MPLALPVQKRQERGDPDNLIPFLNAFGVTGLSGVTLLPSLNTALVWSVHRSSSILECLWVSTLLLHFGTRAYLFSPDEKSCYIFSTQNNCCKFLAPYGVILQSDFHPYFKTSVCDGPFSNKSPH